MARKLSSCGQGRKKLNQVLHVSYSETSVLRKRLPISKKKKSPIGFPPTPDPPHKGYKGFYTLRSSSTTTNHLRPGLGVLVSWWMITRPEMRRRRWGTREPLPNSVGTWKGLKIVWETVEGIVCCAGYRTGRWPPLGGLGTSVGEA